MALVSCPECGRENVSDSAVSCPECGYNIKEHFIKLKVAEEKHQEKEKQKAIEAENRRKKKEHEHEEQKEIIEKLENRLKELDKEITVSFIVFLISLPLTIITFTASEHGSLGVFIVICAFATIISGGYWFGSLGEKNTVKEDLENAKYSLEKYEREQNKRIEAINAMAKVEQSKHAAKHPKCPLCGSHNTERIGTISRSVSVAAVGLASSKIGKQYKCKNCKHMW